MYRYSFGNVIIESYRYKQNAPARELVRKLGRAFARMLREATCYSSMTLVAQKMNHPSDLDPPWTWWREGENVVTDFEGLSINTAYQDPPGNY